MKKCLGSLLCTMIVSVASFGQTSIRPNMYVQDMNFYNPAGVPLDTSHDYYFSLLGKQKFLDEAEEELWDKSTALFFNHLGRIGRSSSYYSIAYLRDPYSFFTRHGLNLGYIRQLAWGKSRLLLSGRLVLNFDRVNWDDWQGPLSETGFSTGLNPDLDVGVEYRTGGFSAGLAGRQIFGTTSTVDDAELIVNRRALTFHASYLFRLGQNFGLAPFLLTNWERQAVVDAGLFLTLFDTLRLSYALRINELRSIVTAELRILQSLYLGAAIDRSSLLPDNNLDIVLKYTF